MNNLKLTFNVWQDVLARLGRMPVSWRGVLLSERDLRTYTEAIVLCALHLTDLSTRFDGVGSRRELIAWATNVAALDVSDVGSFLSDAVVVLRKVDGPTSYSWFKRQLRDKYPFVGMYVAPIKRGLTSFLESPSYRGFYLCYQFLSFLTHTSLEDIAVDLEGEYEELESNLRGYTYDPALLSELNSVMREWTEDFVVNEDNFIPAHGPGATANSSRSAGLLVKYRYLATDSLLTYVFRKFAGVDVTSYFPFPALSLERTAKAVTVPKSIKTRRWISLEPATLQFLQQGISRVIVDFIHSHSELKAHINLRVQALNAEMAIRSSGDGSHATIDLSSASDTVTTTLVKAVFSGTPMYPFLVALRSRSVVLPSGKVLGIEKFAPMGSALCFPIQTLIFACAIEVAVRRRRYVDEELTSYRVYGDDIIVQDQLFADALCILRSLGFVINESKSYAAPYRFRESCGGEGYDGRTVTPMKISRRYKALESGWSVYHAPLYEGLIDMANSCHRYEFSLTRAWIVRVLLSHPLGPPLFSETGLGALYSPRPDNFRAKRKWNSDLHRLEVEVLVSRTPGENTSAKEAAIFAASHPDLEAARYFETLRLSSDRDGDMFEPDHRIQVPRSSKKPKLMKVWLDPVSPGNFSQAGDDRPWVNREYLSLRHLLGVDDDDITFHGCQASVTDDWLSMRNDATLSLFERGAGFSARPCAYASMVALRA